MDNPRDDGTSGRTSGIDNPTGGPTSMTGLAPGEKAPLQAVIMIPRDHAPDCEEGVGDPSLTPLVPGEIGGDYGYIEGTLGSNDGPLDVVVLTSRRTVIGQLIPIRVLAVLQRGPEFLVLSVAGDEPSWGYLREMEDVERTLLAAIGAASFNPYLEPRPDAPFSVWHGRRQAEDVVERALRDFECAEDQSDFGADLT